MGMTKAVPECDDSPGQRNCVGSRPPRILKRMLLLGLVLHLSIAFCLGILGGCAALSDAIRDGDFGMVGIAYACWWAAEMFVLGAIVGLGVWPLILGSLAVVGVAYRFGPFPRHTEGK